MPFNLLNINIIVFLFCRYIQLKHIFAVRIHNDLKKYYCRLLVNFGFFFVFGTILYANAFLFEFVFCLFVCFFFPRKGFPFLYVVFETAFFSKMEMHCICYMMNLSFSVACLTYGLIDYCKHQLHDLNQWIIFFI